MPTFRLLKPFAVVRGKESLHYSTYGKVVELSDKEAGPLVDEGRVEPISKTEAKKVEKEQAAAEEAAPAGPGVAPPPVGTPKG